MKKQFTILLAILAVFVAAGIVLLVTHKVKGPVLVSRNDPPKIRFEEYTHDLGTVMEGVELPFIFKIRNIGGEPLVIKDVATSCGCTLLNLKDKVIEPGKTGDLEVIMDTTMKQGYVKKKITVTSNDPKRPTSDLFLSANIQENPNKLKIAKGRQNLPAVTAVDPHKGMEASDTAKIFTGQCATCHVNAGKGKMGAELFAADCAMCHGQHAEGTSVAPALVPGNYHDAAYTEQVQKTIRLGSAKSITMPGFSTAAGGPLTDAEIESLVQFLQTKSDQARPSETAPAGH